ncbi:HAMP domain-containing sensor histidine kinase [Devosia sp.]|uniref:sensor histidine kinase n=1 Tax=Devosia sp. TaxID=1871048 RepID=UPI001AD48AF1|nr:HAMP domain-containing sensor histidine kinase [Devosia sp.]MBN9332945.1 HAMP domain-containing histidine kinase [Devosia sp.]
MSLRRVLSRGLIAIQIVVIISYTLLAAVPFLLAVASQQGLDDGVVDDIVRSVQRIEDRSFYMSPTPALAHVVETYPNFWFILIDADGNVIKQGNVPTPISLFPQNLTHVSSANFSDFGDPRSPFAVVRTRNSSYGRLWVMTGGGPSLGFNVITKAFGNPMFIGLMVLLSGATMLTIPPLIRRSLAGVEQVAREAALVDIGQSDVRLPYDRVPTELIPLVRAFNEALDRLDSGIVRQRRFLADAAHELRTPIAILQTRLESLPDGPEKRQLQRDSARLGGMANELLDLHRMALSPDAFETVDLVDLAAQVTADLAPLAIDAGNDIEFVAPEKPVEVKGDASALSRAVANLIHNAMAHGGPEVDIRVTVEEDGRIGVSDNGPGVDLEHREEIFWPFHRLSQSPHGAGLGLSLVRDIIKRHGGKITVTTAPQGGALFEISLPVIKA